MDTVHIVGNTPLCGEVRVQGSKNAALPLMAAAILNKGVTRLKRCPKILDVHGMIQILESLGCYTYWDDDTLVIDATFVKNVCIFSHHAKKMRSSIILFGALLGRNQEATIAYPGGCVIGERPIGFHIDAIQKMNVEICLTEEVIHGKTCQLQGAEIVLPFPSVGATENAILVGVLADGNTQIKNAAKEPEIIELCHCLRSMGANIYGEGTNIIQIKGVSYLNDTEYEIGSDRIVAGTYLFAAVATRGHIVMEYQKTACLTSVFQVMQTLGAIIQVKGNRISLDGSHATNPIPFIETTPYPGFPTDLQSQLLATVVTAKGISRIRETIFEKRFETVGELNHMGALIQLENQEARILGVDTLYGREICAKDLRGGAALIIAGLSAKGKTKVCNMQYVNRGYVDICSDLKELGANICCL